MGGVTLILGPSSFSSILSTGEAMEVGHVLEV